MTTLYVDTTARYQNAATADLCARILVENGAPVIYRPINDTIAHAIEIWRDVQFEDPKTRTPRQTRAVETAETLSGEYFMVKDIIINIPLSNGAIPSSFRAWVDMIALADFDMDDDCAGGFRNKSATLVVASGGLNAGSERDTLTPQLISLLNFIGIEDVTIVAADQTSPGAPAQEPEMAMAA